MTKINSAASVLKFIGGTAELIGLYCDSAKSFSRTVKVKHNPAGSKLSRQLARGIKGLTCSNGFPINSTRFYNVTAKG